MNDATDATCRVPGQAVEELPAAVPAGNNVCLRRNVHVHFERRRAAALHIHHCAHHSRPAGELELHQACFARLEKGRGGGGVHWS